MEEDSGPSLQIADNPRRRFIKQSIAGGVVAALSTHQSVLATQATAAGCGQPSKSDWLVGALAFVTQISIEAYSKINVRVVQQLNTYKSAFDDLHCLLSELAREMARSPVTARSTVNQMQTLAELGRSNSGLVNATFKEGEKADPLFFTLALVSQEICAQAQNIQPEENEWKLSKQASGILKKTLELIASERFVTLRAGVVTTQASSSVEKDAVNKLLSQIHLAIAAARNAILLVENPDPRNSAGEPLVVNKAEQQAIYNQSLDDALTALKTLIADNRVDSRLPENFRNGLPAVVLVQAEVRDAVTVAATASGNESLPAVDSLVLGLGTCRRETEVALKQPVDGEFRFMRASYASPVVVDRNAMGNLLWKHCPPGSRDQIDAVDSIVALVGGWSIWLPQTARACLIGSALFWANKVHRISCTGNRDLKSLAEGLAALV